MIVGYGLCNIFYRYVKLEGHPSMFSIFSKFSKVVAAKLENSGYHRYWQCVANATKSSQQDNNCGDASPQL